MNDRKRWECTLQENEGSMAEADMVEMSGPISCETIDSLTDFADCIWDESIGEFMTVERLAGLLEVEDFYDGEENEMGVYDDLLCHQVLAAIQGHIQEQLATAEEQVPHQAVAVLGEIQKVMGEDTTDFEKVEKIVEIFYANGMDANGCHDF